MKRLLLVSLMVMVGFMLKSQSYNPFLNQGIISPAPLLPAELDGVGTCSFNVGNTGSTPLPLVSGDEMVLEVALLNGVPNTVDPLDALGGPYLGFFDWVYDPGLNTFYGTQNQVIPASSFGGVTVAYRVTVNTPITVADNGFSVTLIPPDYTFGFNSTDDDFVSSYTYVRATDYGDAPLSYGSAGAEINLFRNSLGNYTNFMFLGDTIDHETVYLASAQADGDDLDNLDDEDGVTLPAILVPGSTIMIPIVATVRGGIGVLNAWIDWNGDGVFQNASEKIVDVMPVFSSQIINVEVTVPEDATPGITFARFRFGANIGPIGFASYGEVEDYMVVIQDAQPAISLTKTGTYIDNPPLGEYNAGDQINYQFTVSNIGSVPLFDVIVTDPLVNVIGGPIDILDVGESDNNTFSAIYTLTQADLDAGFFTNVATAIGIFDNEEYTDEDNDIQNFIQNPEIELLKSGTWNDANSDGFAQAGETITYEFTVENTGNVTVTNLVINDATIGVSNLTVNPSTLAPGQTGTATATYVVTQADVDAGGVYNLAIATGQDPDGEDVEDESEDPNPLTPPNPDCPDCTYTVLPQNPMIQIVKTSTTNPNTYSAEGDILTYNLTVTNTGNVTLTNVDVSDPVATVSGSPIASLAPGQSQVLTATYEVTQADVDNGLFINVATATGNYTDPDGEPQTVTDDDDETVFANQQAFIQIVKTSTTVPNTYSNVGDVLTYNLAVTNTGTVTLTNVVVSDPVAVVTGSPIAELAPGQTVVLTASYTVSQADIDAGFFTNVATATGEYEDVNGNTQTVTDEDDETITATQNPEIELLKSGTWNDANSDGFAQAGETITYEFTVENTGNVTVTNLVINDATIGVSNLTVNPSTLAPGQTGTAIATYVVTQADVDAGGVYNLAIATGQDPDGEDVEDESEDPNPLDPNDPNYDPECPDCTYTDLPQNPEIELLKSGTWNDLNSDGYAQAGETITYVFTVENTGNVTVTNLVINDATIGVNNLVVNPSTLAPGETGTATATYVVTQADVDAGGVYNLAIATGQDPDGEDVEDESEDPNPLDPNDPNYDPECPDCTYTDLPQNPEIELLKSGTWNDANSDGFAQAGETITYEFTVENTGNVTVTNLVINDATIGVSNLTVNPSTLAPGATGTATATYVVTQADVDAGGVYNLAIATGQDPDGEDVEDESEDPNPLDPNDPNYDPECPDCTYTDLPQNPEIELLKSGTWNDLNGDGFAQAGETITYEFTVENTGNVTVTGLVINDATIGVANLMVDPSTLAPGATGTATATYVVTQADVDAGGVYNLAIATGQDPDGDDVEDESEDPNPLDPNDPNYDPECPDCTYTDLPQDARIQLVKSSTTDPNTYSLVGDVLTYNLVVTNTGSVTLNDVLVEDPIAIVLNGQVGTLAPGESAILTASYNVTPGDLTLGYFINTANTIGFYTNSVDELQNVTDTDDETIVATPIAVDDMYSTPFETPVSGDVSENDTYPDGSTFSTTSLPSDGTLVFNPDGTFEYTPNDGFSGTDIYTYEVCFEFGSVRNCSEATVTITVDGLSCIGLDLKVLLEGPYVDNGSNGSTMTTKLNDLGYLPGQRPVTFLGLLNPAPAGQPYKIAPWNYMGTEGDDMEYVEGNPSTYKAGYPSNATDWVLVSLRTGLSASTTVCQRAAILLNDGTVQLLEGFDCCELNVAETYYIVVEHRNHLVVMSHQKVAVTSGSLIYDFTTRQSYRSLLGFGQKLINGKYVMFAGNSMQVGGSNPTDINTNDNTFWLSRNGLDNSGYFLNDFDLNGDVNVQDKNLWLQNNGTFTDVQRP
jgi:uncharacterized repeat protein (TIGR01451 family)